MKLYSSKNISLICALGFSLAITSCEKYVETDTPPSSVGAGEAFSDSSTATSVVLGLYGGIASQNSTGNFQNTCVYSTTVYGAMSADEGYYLTNSAFDVFRYNTLAANSVPPSFWYGLYQRISRANYAIEGVIKAGNLTTAVKNQLLGEAKFIRAWCYFYLLNFFGETPLVLNTDALSSSQLPKSPVADVYKQIVQDLTEAKDVLTTTYPSTERARVNKNVVSAFLARVYFYQQDWANAAAEATNVIGSGAYSLVTNLNNVFVNTSNETIWQISLAGTTTPQTIFGTEFLPSGTTPVFVMYDTLANTFEAGDQRKVNWAKPITYLSKTYYYPYKYKVRSTTTGNEYPVMIRLAEMYLIRAEARAKQNDISGSQQDLDAIRVRAGLAKTTATTQAELVTALEHERWVELFTEFSDRWLNLKRTDRATAVLSLIKPAWKPFQQLYPLPLAALTANTNLRDNKDY